MDKFLLSVGLSVCLSLPYARTQAPTHARTNMCFIYNKYLLNFSVVFSEKKIGNMLVGTKSNFSLLFDNLHSHALLIKYCCKTALNTINVPKATI
jgi:hypothetical protein